MEVRTRSCHRWKSAGGDNFDGDLDRELSSVEEGLFDDFTKNGNNSKAAGHVTMAKFFQALSAKGEVEVAQVARKFDDLRNGMMNYIAFTSENQVCRICRCMWILPLAQPLPP